MTIATTSFFSFMFCYFCSSLLFNVWHIYYNPFFENQKFQVIRRIYYYNSEKKAKAELKYNFFKKILHIIEKIFYFSDGIINPLRD
jgi:hypothetical protein